VRAPQVTTNIMRHGKDYETYMTQRPGSKGILSPARESKLVLSWMLAGTQKYSNQAFEMALYLAKGHRRRVV
jgi:hypothetical protein